MSGPVYVVAALCKPIVGSNHVRNLLHIAMTGGKINAAMIDQSKEALAVIVILS